MSLGAILVSIGLAATPASAQTSLPSQPPGQSQPASAPLEGAGAPVDPKTFVMGPEDVIHIGVWGEDKLSGLQTIRLDGKITMPLLNDVQAAGLTPERLGAQLTQALAADFVHPVVTVRVMQVNSRKFSIQGEVLRAGTFSMPVPIRIFDALSLSGGFRDFAKKGDILIIRANGAQVLHFSYTDFIHGKHLEKNIALENGDTIVVK